MKKLTCLLLLFLLFIPSAIRAKSASDINIYDYLKTDGRFNVSVRLIDDLKYTDILSYATGKTLFVANDSAFNEFFKTNQWGVTSYEQLTLAQKKFLFKFSLFNNAYTLSDFSNYFTTSGLIEGPGMRKASHLNVLDSIPYIPGNQLPASKYWDSKRLNGIRILCDNTVSPTVFFTQSLIDKYSLTDEDLKIITGINSRSYNDVHIFNDKIIERDIQCKNGYIHVLQSVLIPHENMAQFISDNKNGDAGQTTKIFSKLLNRFSAPYFDNSNTKVYKQLYPEFTDSIFVKGYFSGYVYGNGYPYYPGVNGQTTGKQINADLLLPYNPGWNSYAGSGTLEADMAAMFVPSDTAMMGYLKDGILKDYGSWENVPDQFILPFIKNCMRTSFIESVPSKFSKMVDENNYRLPVEKNDIVKTYTGVNGEVYVTNKVYPPIEYSSAYSPVLLSNNTKIMNWVISNYGGNVPFYKLYLSSMTTRYSLFFPTDESLTKYIDPIAIAKEVPGALKYWYNSAISTVNATVCKYDKQTGMVGDSIGVITSSDFLLNRLTDLLNSHIVVGDIQSGKIFYMTRGNVPMKIEGSENTMSVREGGNIELNEKANVTRVYNQLNSDTYLIDKPMQSSLTSVYKALSNTPAFSSFFSLLTGFPSTGSSVIFLPLTAKSTLEGIDYNVRFFNAFNYTVYVPTNEAISKAIQDGVITPWVSQGTIVGINDMTDATAKAAAVLKLERFLRYHFQDNSVFVDNQSVNNVYQTAVIKSNDLNTGFGTLKNKFYKIVVTGTDGNLTLTTELGKTAHVITANGLYNIMTRDYVFNYNPGYFKNIDGSGSKVPDFSNSRIYTSSTAVIHQIDAILTFE
jgi:uncharacterized surface protein with fasciclin (FAS1) repeats